MSTALFEITLFLAYFLSFPRNACSWLRLPTLGIQHYIHSFKFLCIMIRSGKSSQSDGQSNLRKGESTMITFASLVHWKVLHRYLPLRHVAVISKYPTAKLFFCGDLASTLCVTLTLFYRAFQALDLLMLINVRTALHFLLYISTVKFVVK